MEICLWLIGVEFRLFALQGRESIFNSPLLNTASLGRKTYTDLEEIRFPLIGWGS